MSFSKQLAQRNIKSGADAQSLAIAEAARAEDLSIESAIVESSVVVDTGLDEMKTQADDVETQIAALGKADAVETSLGDLVDKTIETYGEDGITEQGAELLQISVESVLRAAGINIPVSAVVPSFESGMTRAEYSTEAEEKSKGFLAKIGEWVAKAWQALIDAVKSFVNSFRTNVTSVRTYVSKVKAKVDKMKGDGKGKPVKLGGAGAAYLPSGGGKPDANLGALITSYQKFVGTWDGTWGPVTKAGKLTKENIDAVFQGSRGWLHNGVSHITNVAFIPSHTITVKNGSDTEYPLIGASYEIKHVGGETGKGQTTALNKSEMTAGLERAEAALKVCETVEKKINEWVKAGESTISTARTAGFWTGVAAASMEKDRPHEALRAKQTSMFLKSLVGAQRVISGGWSKTMYHLLSAIRANVVYVERSVGGKEGETRDGIDPSKLKTTQAPNHKALGHDANGAKSKPEKVGETYDH